jgi:hypothetical protein
VHQSLSGPAVPAPTLNIAYENFKWAPKKQNGEFTENGCNDFDGISITYGDLSLNRTE